MVKRKNRYPVPPVLQALRPFQEFTEKEASGGLILLFCTVAALLWANSPWRESYEALWHTELSIGIGHHFIEESLHFWINDGLMVIFFFVIGLEIKREMLVGELASPRKAALPIFAAAGGMVVPAFIYLLFNAGTAGAPGWGIPMATDIAFAIGVLALLGPTVPVTLKIFLVALAIVDDIGAVLVIAFFYTAEISWISLGVGAIILGLLMAANRSDLRHPLIYGGLGLLLWFAFYQSGVHPTIAGVLLAMTIPARARIRAKEFLGHGRELLDDFERSANSKDSILTNAEGQSALEQLEEACRHAETPMQRMEHTLHPWVTFAIMPIFALSNAGVTVGEGFAASLFSPISLGIILGLVLGKQVGITLFSWLAVRTGLASMPTGVRWLQIYGTGWLGGIGFTMSLFIANLAFPTGEGLPLAKVGILTASALAGGVGWLILKTVPTPSMKEPA